MTQAGTASYEAKVPQSKAVVVAGSFLPNGSSAVATTYGAVGWTVARTGAGVFRVTFTRKFAAFIAVTLGLTIDATTADQQLISSALTAPTASADGYFDITYRLAAVATDITASGVLRRISFIAVLAESDVPGNGV